jgi:ribosomal protein S18 acetylase RimI-like enzyme
MTDLKPPVRGACREDAEALAELIDMAGEGLPLYLWAKMAKPGETAREVGRRRAAREEGGFSYKNAIVIDQEGRVTGGLIGYLLPEQPEAIDPASTPAVVVPALELEALVPGTWYVNALACYPDARGQGLGTRLLALAEDLARKAGARGVSVIVSDANAGARRLYQRCGYREVGRRPMVKEDWAGEGEAWLLLVKPV